MEIFRLIKLPVLFFLMLAIVCSMEIVSAPFGSAHILNRDENTGSGVLVHATPNDDPVIGIPSEIFFELQYEMLSTKDYIYSIKVTAPDNSIEPITAFVLGETTIGAKYTFTEQGIYAFVLEGVPSYISGIVSKQVRFTHTQYVFRTTESRNFKWLVYLTLLSVPVITYVVMQHIKHRN